VGVINLSGAIRFYTFLVAFMRVNGFLDDSILFCWPDNLSTLVLFITLDGGLGVMLLNIRKL
jgi:hypothetical protein